MTTAEHQLVLEMFKEQALLYAGLIKALQSRGILDAGDLQAFDALVSASFREPVEQNTKAAYLTAAKMLGVPIDESDLI